MNRLLIILLFWISNNELAYAQSGDLNIKNIIYQFICQEDYSRKLINCENIEKLISDDVLVSIVKIEKKEVQFEDTNMFLFRAAFSPSRAYLLIEQKGKTIIIGKKGKDLFLDMKDLYDFLEYPDLDKINFLDLISKNLFFVYKNNLEFENSNKIRVDK